MNVSDWVSISVALIGVLVGVIGLIIARNAKKSAEGLSKIANTISAESLRYNAKQSITSSAIEFFAILLPFKFIGKELYLKDTNSNTIPKFPESCMKFELGLYSNKSYLSKKEQDCIMDINEILNKFAQNKLSIRLLAEQIEAFIFNFNNEENNSNIQEITKCFYNTYK